MRSKSRFFTILTVMILIASFAVAYTALADTQGSGTALPTAQLSAERTVDNLYGVSETGLYIVQFSEPSLASYTGGIAGLEATSPQATGARRLDANSPASKAYTDYLSQQHSAFAASAEQTLGRSIEVAFDYTAALNGVAVRVDHQEAARLAALPGVLAVYGDTLRELTTDVGPLHIGAPAVWNGDTGSGVATRGEGVVIGVIDSGINSQHPAFAATDGDAYSHTNPYGAGVYNGWCVANPSFCNSKLIAAYGLNPVGGSPEDLDGHGSHTASTSGGNRHDAIFDVGTSSYDISIQGVAPRANIVAYKVCNPSCPGTASVAAVNSAIANDQVDVLNYSISGSDSPWNDPVDIAFLDASNAGIFVSASAGNAGPGASTVAKTGPWNAAVAASTINRVVANTLDVTGPTTPAALQGLAAVPGEFTSIPTDVTGPIRYDPANNDGCTAFAPGYFNGALALIQRGGCTFLVKVTNAANAGATGVVVFNSVGGPPISMGGGLTGTPPAFMLTLDGGIALRDYIIANPTATARVNAATSYLVDNAWEDIVAGFSSRGPSQFELLKPDYIAPGVNILAAVAADGANVVQYGFYQGTSMSSPHGAGAAALMVALQPTWSPTEIKSAMATSAVGGLTKEDGVTPADPFDVGSGLLDLSLASTSGLVFNETGANYLAANPAIGGDPKTLNQPSVVNYNCATNCTWTRTAKSVLPFSATYTATVSGPAGLNITVTPSTFTIAPGAEQVLTISAEVSALPVNVFAFGSIALETDAVFPSAPVAAPTAELLNEQFTDATFPPAGWAVYKLAGAGATTWERDTAQSSSAPASARRVFGGSGDGNQDSWLVTPQITLDSGVSALTFIDAGQWMADYGYSGVLISTASCDPTVGDFVEVAEIDDTPGPSVTVIWRGAPISLDLSAYAEETVCLAFRYSGDFAHTWWIDDVVVNSEPAGALSVADTNIPVVVKPTNAVPDINVAPTSLSATQAPDTTTNQTLNIGNIGTAPLIWNIAEAPLAIRLELNGESPDAPDAPDAPIILSVDDGSGENAIGVGGSQFLWLNRFTPSAGQFPVVLDQVDVMFGYPASTGGINVGELVDIYLYEDADGNPANGAVHRASLTGQAVQAVNGTTWSTYNLAAPVTFNGPGDILIAVVNRTAGVTAGTFPAVIDQSSSSQLRSWAGFGAVPGNPPTLPLPTFGIIDSFGANFAGNWLVRGFGTANAACDTPADVPWLSLAPTGGTTAGGGSSPVTVSFNSTGLALGTYTAILCVNSNDPTTPLVEVPVSLTVEVITDVPNINVDPLTIASTQAGDTTTQQALSIGNTGTADLTWNIFEDATLAPLADWDDNFDSYATGSQLHGQGGWKGWFNDPTAGALISSAQAQSTPNSVAILTTSDLVHEYNETSGQWVYTAWQYIPTDFAGASYFIMLNSYDDAGSNLNWSAQLKFDSATNLVSNDGGVNPGTLPLIKGQWVELRLEINLDADTGAVYYNNQLLYQGTWSGQVSGGGAVRIGAVDLFASGASVIYYDDLSLVDVTPPAICDAPADIPWASLAPSNGTTTPGNATDVTVTLDSTGLADGSYNANLCVASNDPDAGPGNGTDLVVVPLALTVAGDPPTIAVDPADLSSLQLADTQATLPLNIANDGSSDLNWDAFTWNPVVAGTGLSPQFAPAAGQNGQRGANTAASAAPTASDALLGDFTEGFDDITNLPGWFAQNNSTTIGTTGWFQGNSTVFPAHAGAATAYIGANFNNTTGAGTISNWLLTPELTLNNGDTFSFWTRTVDTPAFPDRLELRLSTAGASTNVGTAPTDIGDFTTLLLEVNPTLTTSGYPNVWTQFTVTLSGVPNGATGRFAFRYFVTNGGPSGSNSDYIGIDSVEYVSAAPTTCDAPVSIPWVTVSPISGTLAGGANVDLGVTFDSTGLTTGVYTGTLCISSNDPVTPLVTVPLTLTVADPTYLRVAHLAPFAADPGTAVTVTLNGAPALTNFAYGDSTSYIELPEGRMTWLSSPAAAPPRPSLAR
ncbi:MAG: choice-of-anchor J domain-containing protein [Chloroflexi bacterium]|nr:choice-of-anchor J domain-containing protein [Chloroflexota bacterium]